jgi:hypothetical protein
MKDLAVDRVNHPDAAMNDTWSSDDDDDDGGGGDINIIDKSLVPFPLMMYFVIDSFIQVTIRGLASILI